MAKSHIKQNGQRTCLKAGKSVEHVKVRSEWSAEHQLKIESMTTNLVLEKSDFLGYSQ